MHTKPIPRHKTEYSHIEERKQLLLSGSVPPVPHELTSNREHGQNLDTSGAHAVVGIVGSPEIEGTRGIGIGKDGITSILERQSKEGSADLT